MDIPLHYLNGLGVNAHYLQEELFALQVIKINDLRLYSEHLPANNIPKRLQVESLYNKLKSLLQHLPTSRTHRSTHGITLPVHADVVSVSTIDIAHTLECALQGHPDTTTHDHNPIHALMISAINRARVPNPHQICIFPWCGVKHDPLCCCICFGSNHKTPDCWHLNGLSDNRKELLVKAHSAKIAWLPPFDATPV